MAVSKVSAGMMDAKLAGEDLSSKLYYFVKYDSADTFVLAGDGDMVAGVLVEAVASGAVATAQVDGIAKVVAGGTLKVGERVASDTNGKAVIAASNDYVVGICRTACVSGDITSVNLTRAGIEP